jgi:hypothetical protein
MKIICAECNSLVREKGTNKLISHGICLNCAVKAFTKRPIWKLNHLILKEYFRRHV